MERNIEHQMVLHGYLLSPRAFQVLFAAKFQDQSFRCFDPQFLTAVELKNTSAYKAR